MVYDHLRGGRLSLALALAAAVVLLAAVACGGDGGEDNVSKPEIAAALTGFVEGLTNDDSEGLATYWSSTCEEPERSRYAGGIFRAAGLLRMVLGDGEYRLTVDADALVIDVEDDEHVTVPVEQPAGVYMATLGETALPSDEGEALLTEVPLSLAREDGQWRVVTCALFTSGDEEE